MKLPSVKGLGVIVMAAGLGTRMRSKLVKVLHPIAGRPMLLYTVELAERMADDGVVLVLGHQADQVKRLLEGRLARQPGSAMTRSPAIRTKGMTAFVSRRSTSPLLVAEQLQRLGTGHAVKQARDTVRRVRGKAARTYMILNGDTPLLTEGTLRALLRVYDEEKAAVAILTALVPDPAGYGRIVRTHSGKHRVMKIVEERDASMAERAIREINVGTYIIDGAFLFEALDRLQPTNAQQEYYLTDVIKLAVDRGLTVAAMQTPHVEEALGINSRAHLAAAEQEMRNRIRQRWLQDGVTLLDPPTTWIDADVVIGQDTILYPHVTLEGATRIGADCRVRSHSRIADSRIGDRVQIQDACVITESVVEEEVVIGPFAHLRPGCVVRRKAKVGNFVEMKKTDLGEGSKANHLSYLGDARIGSAVNIGAGTITCNYDGYRKFETIIEDDVFIGSDTQLVAPVTVGRRAVVAAGTTITQDTPPDALAISRAPQVNLAGWAAKRRALLTAPPGEHGVPPSPPAVTKPRKKRTGGK